MLHGCSNAADNFATADVKTYLLIATSGGLNQQRRGGVQLTKFDYRLSTKLDSNLQKLGCRANYHVLKFTDIINEMGKKLVDRMRMKSNHFIALHLRRYFGHKPTLRPNAKKLSVIHEL